MMRGHPAWMLVLSLGLGLQAMAPPAFAVITRLIPLREVLASEQWIFSANVERVDTDKPAFVLRAMDDLKGKAPFRTLSIDLIADRQGQRERDTPRLLKRLAPKLAVIVFSSRRGKRYTAFGYTNGTWFQLVGQTGDEPATVRWSLAHCEPYLRRTFHGSTAELRQVIVDGLAGKKKPPEPDANEVPGLGPEAQPDSEQESRTENRESGSANGYPPAPHRPLFAVIPTFVIVGPFALLAALFPAVFGGLALVMRRWFVLLTMASLNSTLYLGHSWFHASIKNHWWGTPPALWCAMTLVALAGIYWSWRRPNRSEPIDAEPGRGEGILLGSISLIGLAVVAWCIWRRAFLDPPWKDFLVIWSVVWVGAVYTACLRLAQKRRRMAPSTERVMLGALVFACALSAANSWSGIPHVEGVRLVWTFEPDANGAMLSSPALDEHAVYVAAIQGSGLSTYGVVYCLDRQSGEEVWRFDNDGMMQQVFSSPCLDSGRLYIGEGLHENRGSKLYCLDAASGRKLWHFETASHTESSPCVADGNVYVGAGEDGIYCLEATTGAERWHFQENLHVDASPKVVGKYLYAGSGVSRTQKQTQVFCLDAASGRVLWRQAAKLPVWGSPSVWGNRVFFGLGNGRYDRSAEQPAGALLCVDAKDGREFWCYDVDDAVLMSPVADGDCIYFGSRDHHGYCLRQESGQLEWKVDLGDPVVARLLVGHNRIYAATNEGIVYRLDRRSGQPTWVFDVAKYAQSKATLFASPASKFGTLPEHRCRLYVGASLENALARQAVLYCLEDRESEGLAPVDGYLQRRVGLR